MAEQDHHAEVIKGLKKQMKILLVEGEEPVYFYLDDSHKFCNKLFADLLGYKTAKAWADTEAPLSDVIDKDQQTVIDAYMKASEHGIASSIDVSMKNIKTGEIIKTNMILAPIIYEGHIFTIHYVRQK